MRQTRTQHEMFLFRDPMALHPIRIFIASRPEGRMHGTRRAA